MKKIVFLLFLLPFTCPAQNFEIGLNGGVCFHTLPINNVHTEVDKAKISYAAGFKGDLRLPHAQIGVDVEMTEISEYNYTLYPYSMRIYNHVANPLIVPNAFYNHLINLPTGYCYGGISAGPAIARIGVNTFSGTPPGNYTSYTTNYNSATGLAGGIQLGFMLNVSKVLALNAEAAGRYMSIDYKDPAGIVSDNPYRYHLFYFPMTVGLRYKI